METVIFVSQASKHGINLHDGLRVLQCCTKKLRIYYLPHHDCCYRCSSFYLLWANADLGTLLYQAI